jgi:hypothetical protein
MRGVCVCVSRATQTHKHQQLLAHTQPQCRSQLTMRHRCLCAMQAYRRALRRPLPAERNYLAAQFVGVGIQFGPLSRPLGGRIVEGPLPGSPAEAAGE